MNHWYFVISGRDKGGLHVDGPLTTTELKKRLEGDYYGEDVIQFLDSVKGRDDLELDQLIIIRGEIVRPVAEQQVTKWKLP